MAVLARANEDKAGLGIVMMLLAYLVFSLLDTSVKWLVISGLSAFQLAFMRYLGHFVLSLVVIARNGIARDRFATALPHLVLLRAALLVVSTVFNFYSLKYLPLTVTSSIMFSAPIVVCALSWPLLGERVGPWRWFAILFGFIGVLVVIRPFGAHFHWAMLLSIHNAVAVALYSILTRKLSGIVATETMQFYMGLIGTLLLLPVAWFNWQPPASSLEWGLLIALGVWGWGGHEMMTRAHGYAPAHTLMPYTYSFMIYLTITSFVVFGDLPDIWTITGASIVVGSGLIIWHRTKKRGVRV
ncbi:MAG: drug/metabolite transporter (DMT)-like permease [Paracoccaceae bacterium]|jgi:drug/metabolite transporter (DMT)-like permease